MSTDPVLRVVPLSLAGAYVIEPFVHSDERGQFVKNFHARELAEAGSAIRTTRRVLLHFRTRRVAGDALSSSALRHQKLVSCLAGRVLDVLVDLRRGSTTYGESCSLELSAERPQLLWIPIGLAHGFVSLRDGSCVTYKTDCEHAPLYDCGIRWDSFGFDWPLAEEELIVSPRDRLLPTLAEFASPFVDDLSKVA